MEQRHPLSGLRVLEMGSRTTAPYIGKLFTDAGADVLKLESPVGDPFRTWSASGASIPDGEDAAWWRFLNAGKKVPLLIWKPMKAKTNSTTSSRNRSHT